jgi:glutamine synthetase
MSTWDMETNTNLMYDAGAEEQFSQMGRYFVGGLLKHMPALVALTWPSYNSYAG